VLPFQAWKSNNVRKILNSISSNSNMINLQCFYASFIVRSIKIGHGIIIEDLGFAFRRFEVSKKMGFAI